MNPDLPTMAAFWIGPYLSWIEQVGLLSFVKHGHRVILYTHGEVKNVPEGIEVRPASEVFDGGSIPLYKGKKDVRWHPATRYSDYFCWHLQVKTDYIYTDADTICLRPLDYYSREELEQKGFYVGVFFFRLKQNSRAAKLACEFLAQKYPIPPWLPLKERARLRWRKLTGRGVSMDYLHFSIAGTQLRNWVFNKTGEVMKASSFLFYSLHRKYKRRLLQLLFQPSANLKEHLRKQKDPKYALNVNWPAIYNGPHRKFLDDPPPESWLGQLAADLGVRPQDAPVVAAREKNRQYLAGITGDANILLEEGNQEDMIMIEDIKQVSDQNIDLPTIAAFWVGPYLSWIEQMGLLSFVRHGHRVILYTQGEVKNVPEGIEVRPASEVFDFKEIYRVDGMDPPRPLSINADIFKWYLQRETDFIYSDASHFCLQPLSIFSPEHFIERGFIFDNSHLFRMPKNSPTIDLICQFFDQKYPIPHWFNGVKKMRRRFYRLIGRGVPVHRLRIEPLGDVLLHQMQRKTKEQIFNGSHFCLRLTREANKRLFELSPEEFERRFSSEMYHVMIFHSYLLDPEQHDEFVQGSYRDSWIGQRAAALGVDPQSAPYFDTRQKNDEYVKEISKK